MENIFLEVLRLSALSGAMVMAVLIVRLLLRRAPKSLHCFLWMMVGIRLLVPFSIESVFGLIPRQSVVAESFFGRAREGVGESTAHGPQYSFQEDGQETLPGSRQDGSLKKQPAVSGKENPQWILEVGSWIWCVGMVLMAAYFLYSWFHIGGCVRDARAGVYCADSTQGCQAKTGEVRFFWCKGIETPFLFGILRPEIYMPFHMEEEDLPYIVYHELAHKRRRDHWVKPAAFFLLAVHWFNPFIWIAYKMLCRDMELACDEMVIRDMKVKERKAYSRALLNCSVGKEKGAACPVAFGELSVKERIKNILHYKKTGALMVLLGVILCGIVLFCFMTQKKADRGQSFLLTNEAGKAEGAGTAEGVGKAEGAGTAEETGNGNEGGKELVGTDGIRGIEAFGLEEERRKEELEKEREEVSGRLEAQERELTQVSDQAESLLYIREWAEAFCNRDGKKLVSLYSDGLLETLREDGMLLALEEEETGFGWSSPWPWDSGADYHIVDMTDREAQILYYAWTSDPHVTVWEENLTWHMEGGKFVMDSSELIFRDALCTGEEFYSAYPQGVISGTRMDYLSNGAGEALNDNAKANREIYEPLFAPDGAARVLLNLLNNEGKVQITVEEKEKGEARISIEFILDHTRVNVTMIQPFGEDGVWIPQTFAP